MDVGIATALAREFRLTFERLAAESTDQFLPTPIAESILRPEAGQEKGRYLAIDIGGTNLRVGFIELLGGDKYDPKPDQTLNSKEPPVRQAFEKSWPILENLKSRQPDELFTWIGKCIVEVVREGCEKFHLPKDIPLPMGVTFSFPMQQKTISEATLMPMGKGFLISSNLDLGTYLADGYEKARTPCLPPIKVTAILNDSVATLVSFIYQSREDETHKAAMGLICGTGSNATISLPRRMLHRDKLPGKVRGLTDDPVEDLKIAVNTEWSINGSASALHKFGLVSKWDRQLDSEGEKPGFQPLEYMTAGRYLGELGRLILLDYLRSHLDYTDEMLPSQLQQRFGLTTTFLSHFRPSEAPTLLRKLESEFPSSTAKLPFRWSENIALVLYEIAKAIETRAAGLVAASVIGLLACAGDIPLLRDENEPPQAVLSKKPPASPTTTEPEQDKEKKTTMTLSVGYTGGCISHFQDYLADCQGFLDAILEAEFGGDSGPPPVKVVLSPCHDGGILGAGVLCGAATQAASRDI
ncbi:hypothetical protein DL764_010647 [Monosporascus ibericus]|uniref:Phosphotransferase n=1 Tax=Monosporascus ibericus TaxID=155417 RepID=A0A4Q4SUD5_9PEZI|nr:hypothetical protein DL764_010647 [Monosporascus ibericus]